MKFVAIIITIFLSENLVSTQDQCGLRGLCSQVPTLPTFNLILLELWKNVDRNNFYYLSIRMDGFKQYLQSLLNHVQLFVKELQIVNGIPIAKIIK